MRTILHSDANSFYASVEMLHHPELRNVPMAVGGDPEARHGIVLTANYIAKRSLTKRKLQVLGIKTIGKLAEAEPKFLEKHLGKMGLVLSVFAGGKDQTPVAREDELAAVKSIGNSTTTPRALVNNEEVRIIIYLLAESVAARLRENCFKGKVVEISVRDNELNSFTRQMKLRMATDITEEIAEAAMSLFLEKPRSGYIREMFLF